MKIKCVVIDKEPSTLELIKNYLVPFPVLKLLQTFDEPAAGMAFLKSNPIDLLLIDINLSAMARTERMTLLKEKPMVIFLTDHPQFIPQHAEPEVLDYLIKPVSFDRFTQVINKAIAYYQYKQAPEKSSGEDLFVRSEYQLVKINLDEIEYIESVGNYLKINLVREKPVMTLMTLKGLMEKLPKEQFIRIHRSYVVPVEKIRSVGNRKIRLRSAELPVGDSYIDNIKELIKAKL